MEAVQVAMTARREANLRPREQAEAWYLLLNYSVGPGYCSCLYFCCSNYEPCTAGCLITVRQFI